MFSYPYQSNHYQIIINTNRPKNHSTGVDSQADEDRKDDDMHPQYCIYHGAQAAIVFVHFESGPTGLLVETIVVN